MPGDEVGGEWREVLRIAHLGGGLQAVNPPGPLVEVGPAIGEPLTFNLSRFADFPSALESFGLQVIGIEFARRADQLHGLYPNDWRPFYWAERGAWPCWDAQRAWQRLTNAGQRDGNPGFAELCHRVSFELNAVPWRLLDIANAYGRELRAKCATEFRGAGLRFQTANSMFVYLAIHGFLTELATLRDYLAEFLATFVLQPYTNGRTVKTLWKLAQHVLPAASADHPWAAALLSATERTSADPWLANFGRYRNFVVHSAPVAALCDGFLREVWIPLQRRPLKLPSVQLLLPRDPHAAVTARGRDPATTIADEIADGEDAYAYCHAVLRRFVDLALTVAAHSPVRPADMHITARPGDVAEVTWPDPTTTTA